MQFQESMLLSFSNELSSKTKQEHQQCLDSPLPVNDRGLMVVHHPIQSPWEIRQKNVLGKKLQIFWWFLWNIMHYPTTSIVWALPVLSMPSFQHPLPTNCAASNCNILCHVFGRKSHNTTVNPAFEYSVKKSPFWKLNQECLSNFDWNELFGFNFDCESIWDKFKSIIWPIISLYVPIKLVPHQNKHKIRWYPKAIQNFISHKAATWRIFRRTHCPATKLKYLKIANECKLAILTLIKDVKRRFWMLIT